jgi:hypothetical protein
VRLSKINWPFFRVGEASSLCFFPKGKARTLRLHRLEAYASMKPNLSRLAAKNVFFLFLVNFDRHLATTHIFGFGA